jgi:hypothetical protein
MHALAAKARTGTLSEGEQAEVEAYSRGCFERYFSAAMLPLT